MFDVLPTKANVQHSTFNIQRRTGPSPPPSPLGTGERGLVLVSDIHATPTGRRRSPYFPATGVAGFFAPPPTGSMRRMPPCARLATIGSPSLITVTRQSSVALLPGWALGSTFTS